MSVSKQKSEKNDVKYHGKIYTPDFLVSQILDQGHYAGPGILQKHVMENSCGDGQFLVQIVDRYCMEFLKKSNDTEQLKKELERYIHGIDIQNEEVLVCKKRCSEMAAAHGVAGPVKWDLIQGDTLEIHQYDGRMDFVIGNPPYVRIHHLSEDTKNVKQHALSQNGMTDLYITFYEIGLRMLNEQGRLCYITPSSFFTSTAGANLRAYILSHHLLESVCDLKHFQAFPATTYTAIVCLNRASAQLQMHDYLYEVKKRKPVFAADLTEAQYNILGKFYFASAENLQLLKEIILNNRLSDISVKNGFATLADSVFVHDFPFASKHVIPVVKASKGIVGKIFYPYDQKGQLISEQEIQQDNMLYTYLLDNRAALVKRSNEKDPEKYWYAFGRSQAIGDTYKDKLAVSTLMRTADDLKLVAAPSGTGVYSGLYITSSNFSSKQIEEALRRPEFTVYISLLGKYKSGGYYTFSSKDLKCYLDYILGKEGLMNADES